MHRLSTVILALFSLATFLPAADWPCWRGPDGLGVSLEKSLPTKWSKQENVAWKADLPGKGASSPIAAGDRIYLTTQMPDTALHVLAINRANGQVLWTKKSAVAKFTPIVSIIWLHPHRHPMDNSSGPCSARVTSPVWTAMEKSFGSAI
jgi:hypothetical protein